jgi:hypothetical protein
MYDVSYHVYLAAMEDKCAEQSTRVNKVFFRMSESTARLEAVKALQPKITKVEYLAKKWETTMQNNVLNCFCKDRRSTKVD